MLVKVRVLLLKLKNWAYSFNKFVFVSIVFFSFFFFVARDGILLSFSFSWFGEMFLLNFLETE